jgi:Ni/Co efflux regulator RcnB
VRFKRFVGLCTAAVLALGTMSVAGDHGNGHGKHHDDDDDQGRYYYSDRDRDDVHHWYREHDHDRDGLPPGLAKRDQLPPGLEKQLRVRGTLPPGLRKKMYPCPEEVERRLPPPPAGCEHTVIGGHIVLENKSTYAVLDIIHFER